MSHFRWITLAILSFSLILTSCSKDDEDTKNKGPVAEFSVTPPNGNISTVFNFDASACSDENEATSELKVRWDWENDNQWDTEYSKIKTTQHQFENACDYTVVLEVKDREGWTDKTQKNISVAGSGSLSFQTGSVSDITTTSALFTGNISSVGQAEILQHGHCWSYFQNPTMEDSRTELGATAVPGSFESNLYDLIESLDFFVRAYVTTTSGTFYGEEISFTVATSANGDPCPGEPGITDSEGNVYHTVLIDGKCWMKENLKTGTMISSSQNQADNGNLEKYCYHDEEKYCEVFGGLYQWDELMAHAGKNSTQGICPDGWRLPDLDELKTLEATFGNGYDLLSQGIAVSATNASGFSALLAGYKSYLPDEFAGYKQETRFWSGEEYFLSDDQAYSLSLDIGGVIQYPTKNKLSAYSVRCIKDE
ncbi:MAG: hypothetical protein K9G58_05745 [Bacteroidales bacterium]|nr:hypothetical protein [Bacteroidales bacterium]MCF8388290.1 hypothetical protein [Bacteroidales bacterium]MCF8397648.1 hypothetical protein [Bacteroidales bacterium]